MRHGSISEGKAERTAIWRTFPSPRRTRIAECVAYLVALTMLFGAVLAELFVYASQHELHSHIPLIPIVVIYLLWDRKDLRTIPFQTSLIGAAVFAAIGFTALVALVPAVRQAALSANDQLALQTAAYLSFVVAGVFLFLGARWVWAAAFPLAFLVFMIPLPDAIVYWMEMRLVAASADVAAWLIALTGTPLLRDGTMLTLPGIVLQVAQECSGIRSSWALFISSVLAANFFIERGWRRILLVAFVIPLGIVRNGFRILVIGLLCVRIGPQMIDSPIHRRGGPVFFVLSLVPLFLLLIWLRQREQKSVTHS